MMAQNPVEVLKKYFGYDDFRENQLEIIKKVLNGEDAFVLMPTGSGKSICYQIPAILCRGMGVIISPLIALMEDQVKALQQNGVKAAYLNSTLSFQEVQSIQRRAAAGRLDVLYVAPERLLTPDFQHFLTHVSPGLFAIDEAHCVSQWGHDFRPEYLRINEVTDTFPDTPRMALTATADSVTRKDILEKLDLRQANVFISSFDRPNIHYQVQVKNRDKHQLINFIRSKHPEASGIVYARTRKRTENIAEWLSQRGVHALPYHAGLPPEVRMENQKRFQENRIRVIVATIAFGMGIDKPDVRFVAHVDLPASMEAYYQETGRAGRDGLPADAWMVYSLSDVTALRRLFQLSEGSDEFKNILRQKLEALLGYCESVVCRRKLILNYFGETHDGGCQCCDNCLTPIDTWDGTVAAQKALSCVYRTGERFGAHHLIRVLMGKKNRQVERWRHDRLKTFGVGQDLDEKTWMSVFRQLLSSGLLSVDMGQMSGFRLTEESWKVLTGEKAVSFRKDMFTKNEKSPDAPDAQKDLIIGLLRAGKLTSAEIGKKVGVSPPTVWAYKAQFTMGKYDTYGGKEPTDEDLSTDWEPDSAVATFVRQKIEKLGRIESVKAHYNDDSLISTYARRMAPKVLNSESKKAEGLHPYFEEIRKKHPGAYEPWTEDGDRKLEQDYRNGISISALSKSFGRTRGAIEARIKKLNLTARNEHAVVRPDTEDPLQKSMVCFAVSRKYQGYCVAGKEMTMGPASPWIRPVSSSAMGELPLKTIQLEDGNTPQFLDIVEFIIKKPLPHYYQAENCLIDGHKKWKKVGCLKPEELVHYCDHMEALWINGHHSSKGTNDRIPIEVANEQCESSLVLIEPQEFSLVLTTGLTFKQTIRAEFGYNGDIYNLSVTDPVVEKVFADRTAGRYTIADRPLYLCISLGEPLEGFCYKLVAGVIGLKG